MSMIIEGGDTEIQDSNIDTNAATFGALAGEDFFEAGGDNDEETDDDPGPLETKQEIKKPAATEKEKPAADVIPDQPKPATAKFVIPKATTEQGAQGEGENKQPAEIKPSAQKPTLQDFLKEFKREEVAAAMGIDDWTLQLHDFRKGGGDPHEYLEKKGRDWSKVSDVDMVKTAIKKQFSFLEGEDLDIKTEQELRKYGLHPDASETEKRIGAVELKVDARKYRGEAVAEQQKFQIPAAQSAPNKTAGPTPQEQYVASVNEHPETKALIQNKKVVADGGEEGYQYTFEVDDPQELVDILTNPKTYAKYMFDESGKPNIAKQNLLSLVAVNPQFVFKSLIDHGRELEKSARLTSGQRVSKTKEVIPPGAGSKSLTRALVEDGKDLRLGDIM